MFPTASRDRPLCGAYQNNNRHPLQTLNILIIFRPGALSSECPRTTSMKQPRRRGRCERAWERKGKQQRPGFSSSCVHLRVQFGREKGSAADPFHSKGCWIGLMISLVYPTPLYKRHNRSCVVLWVDEACINYYLKKTVALHRVLIG